MEKQTLENITNEEKRRLLKVRGMADLITIIDSEVVDGAYENDPPVEHSKKVYPAGEIFTEEQLWAACSILKVYEKPIGFCMRSYSYFSGDIGSSYGNATVTFFYQENNDLKSKVLFEGDTPRQGIKEVKFKRN